MGAHTSRQIDLCLGAEKEGFTKVMVKLGHPELSSIFPAGGNECPPDSRITWARAQRQKEPQINTKWVCAITALVSGSTELEINLGGLLKPIRIMLFISCQWI